MDYENRLVSTGVDYGFTRWLFEHLALFGYSHMHYNALGHAKRIDAPLYRAKTHLNYAKTHKPPWIMLERPVSTSKSTVDGFSWIVD